MAGEWATARLGELCDFRAGSVFKPALQGRSAGEFPFVKVSDMNLPANAVRIQDANNRVSRADLRELRAKPFPPGTVVFAKIGEALRQNRLRQVARETVVDNNMMGAVPRNDRVDARFFYYALSRFDFSEIAQGTALPYLTVASLSGLTLDVPPLPEQRAIAHILGTLDDKIELNRRMSETLEAIARALFKSWFVDFDPVRAKMEGRDPRLPEDIADLFPDRLVESELGEIPEGWDDRPLYEILVEANERVGQAEVPEYSSTNDGLQLRSERFKKKLSASSTKNKLIRRGDLVFGLSRRVLNFGLMRDEIGSVSPVYRVFAVDSEVVEPDLVERVMRLRSNYYYNAVSASSREGQSVSREALGVLRFAVPGKSVQSAFYRLTEALQRRISACEAQGGTLADLRDALLPRLITGELRVGDTARFPSEVAS